MPLSSADVTKQIKAANDIVDVLASYLGPVHSAGKLFKAICPFHQDTRPSLQIDRHWQNYHCWACGAKGDVLTFVEKYEKVGFKEARTILARRAGIKLESEPAADDPKQQLFEVMRWAQEVYQQCYLESDKAAEARRYMGSGYAECTAVPPAVALRLESKTAITGTEPGLPRQSLCVGGSIIGVACLRPCRNNRV